MNRPHAWISLAFLLGLWAQAGCLSLHKSAVDPVSSLSYQQPAAKTAIELPPNKAAEVCLATAEALDKNGHEAEAIIQYEKARRDNPKFTQVSRRLAVLYDRQGNSERAVEEYEKAINANPKDPDLLNDIGYFYYEHNNWKEAEKHLRKAITINPDHQRAWVNLGLVLGQQERYPESYQAFVKVVSPARANSNVGVLQSQHGKFAEAAISLRLALTQEPTLKQAQVVLAQIDNPHRRDTRASLTTKGLPHPKEEYQNSQNAN